MPKVKADPKPCPIQGCSKKWKTRSGLFSHLYMHHLKAELITWILQHVGIREKA